MLHLNGKYSGFQLVAAGHHLPGANAQHDVEAEDVEHASHQITVSNGSDTMTVTDIIMRLGVLGNNVRAGALSTSGWRYIWMGGTLQIAAGQATGAYTGSLTLTCGYE